MIGLVLSALVMNYLARNALAVFGTIAANVVWTMLNDGQAQPIRMPREDQGFAAGALGS